MPKADLDTITLGRTLSAEPVPIPPDNLIRELCGAFCDLRGAWWVAVTRPQPDEQVLDKMTDILASLTDQVVGLRSQTVADLQSKASMLTAIYGTEPVDMNMETGTSRALDARITYSILADLGVRV